jgi:hypothetical protein
MDPCEEVKSLNWSEPKFETKEYLIKNLRALSSSDFEIITNKRQEKIYQVCSFDQTKNRIILLKIQKSSSGYLVNSFYGVLVKESEYNADLDRWDILEPEGYQKTTLIPYSDKKSYQLIDRLVTKIKN